MVRKIIPILFVLIFIFSLSACSNEMTEEHICSFTLSEKGDEEFHLLTCGCGIKRREYHSYETVGEILNSIKYMCAKCSLTITRQKNNSEASQVHEHKYENGRCLICGNQEPLSPNKNGEFIVPHNFDLIHIPFKLHQNNIITSFIIMDGVQTIIDLDYRYDFREGLDLYGCVNLEEVYLPDSLGDIKFDFTYCSSLYKVKLPDSVTHVDGFSSCYSLEEIVLPSKTTTIGEYAFGHCVSLRYVYIPAGVTDIGSRAFSECDSLEIIEFGGTKEQWKNLTDYKDIFYQSHSQNRRIICSDGIA